MCVYVRAGVSKLLGKSKRLAATADGQFCPLQIIVLWG